MPKILAVVLLCSGFAEYAYADAALQLPEEPGMQASTEELLAWRLVQAERPIKARELAELIVKKDPHSYVAQLVLGAVQHYAEGNFPKALYHLQNALNAYERRHSVVLGDRPTPQMPWRWHAILLQEIGAAHYDLEHYEERLQYIDRYNRYYQPKMIAERAWPLMKLGRFAEARQVARMGISSPDLGQQSLGHNALCAIEFEAGEDDASYTACAGAVAHTKTFRTLPTAVDLSNFAEASRSVFKLDEAEQVSLQATAAHVSWYANPWLDLAELYIREARFAEALAALKQIGPYRAKRPAHVRDADRSEIRRAIASLLLLLGKVPQALEVSSRAMVMPDRRAHTSRDPNQDRVVVALLDRRNYLMLAQTVRERALAKPWYKRWAAWTKSVWYSLQAWHSGRTAVRVYADNARLVGMLRIGSSQSAVTPPWLVGELVQVLGPGVMQQAIVQARRLDKRVGASAYYDAFACEAALAQGDEANAVLWARRASEGLPVAEALLRARVQALWATALDRQHRIGEAMQHYEAAYDVDPGVFRRLNLSLPVRFVTDGSPLAESLTQALGFAFVWSRSCL